MSEDGRPCSRCRAEAKADARIAALEVELHEAMEIVLMMRHGGKQSSQGFERWAARVRALLEE